MARNFSLDLYAVVVVDNNFISRVIQIIRQYAFVI